ALQRVRDPLDVLLDAVLHVRPSQGSRVSVRESLPRSLPRRTPPRRRRCRPPVLRGLRPGPRRRIIPGLTDRAETGGVQSMDSKERAAALLASALRLAARGFRVFPVRPNSTRPPLLKGWSEESSTDPGTIR